MSGNTVTEVFLKSPKNIRLKQIFSFSLWRYWKSRLLLWFKKIIKKFQKTSDYQIIGWTSFKKIGTGVGNFNLIRKILKIILKNLKILEIG